MPPEFTKLAKMLARLPGLGPRSAKRAVIAMLTRPETVMLPLAQAIDECANSVQTCSICGNLDSVDPCRLCQDEQRDASLLCVVSSVEDLWSFEGVSMYRGRYHVLGGMLSALDERGPDEIGIDKLLARIETSEVSEVIIALGATMEGQTTGYYIADRLRKSACKVTRLAHGLPVGGELNYLDEGTLTAALLARQEM